MAEEKKSKLEVKEVFNGEEIIIKDFVILVYERRFLAIKAIFGILIFGILVSLTSPTLYTSTSTFIPEGGTGTSSSSLKGIADLAGIGKPSTSSGGLGVIMYQEIINSDPILFKLINSKFYFNSEKKEISLNEYFNSNSQKNLIGRIWTFMKSSPGKLIKYLTKKRKSKKSKKSGASSESKEESQIVKYTSGQISAMRTVMDLIRVNIDEQTISITVSMPEPQLSVEVNLMVQDLLIEYVTSYETIKERRNLEFITNSAAEAKIGFVNAQTKLAEFRDQNSSLMLQISRSEEERLKAEFDIAFSLYKNLTVQMEQTKINIQNDTPIFTDFAPATVPHKSSSPDVQSAFYISLFAGIFLSFLLVLGNITYEYFRD